MLRSRIRRRIPSIFRSRLIFEFRTNHRAGVSVRSSLFCCLWIFFCLYNLSSWLMRTVCRSGCKFCIIEILNEDWVCRYGLWRTIKIVSVFLFSPGCILCVSAKVEICPSWRPDTCLHSLPLFPLFLGEIYNCDFFRLILVLHFPA